MHVDKQRVQLLCMLLLKMNRCREAVIGQQS